MDTSWMQDTKAAFDLVRMAIGTLSDLTNLLPEGEKREVATKAIENAERQTKVAEASIAKALGFELCKCEFPPTPMLTVGYRMVAGGVQMIDECPRCSITSAGGFSFTRNASRVSG